MYVKQVTLKNVRQFRKKTFRFNDGFNLLVGENGCGKTTILQSLHVALGSKNKSQKRPQFQADDIHLNSSNLEINVGFESDNDSNRAYIYKKPFGRRSSRIGGDPAIVSIYYRSNEAVTEGLKSRARRQHSSTTQQQTERIEQYLYESTGELEIEMEEGERFGKSAEIRLFVLDALKQLSDRFHNFGWKLEPYDCSIKFVSNNKNTENGKRQVDTKQLSSLIMRYFQDSRNPFAEFDQHSVSIDFRGRIVGALSSGRELERVTPGFRELLEKADVNSIGPKLLESMVAEIKLTPRIVVQGPEGDLFLSQLSDGEQRMFSLIVDIARILSISGNKHIRETAAVVMIDEIDVHLHPKWQRKIVPMLEDLFPACQFIASTHSPFVIQSVDFQKIIQPNRDSSFHSDNQAKSIEDIVEEIQGVEIPQRSVRAERLSLAAELYFSLLKNANASPSQLEEAEMDYRLASEAYTSNPAAHALLKIEKLRAEKK